MKFHNLQTFFKYGWKQLTTIIGLLLIIWFIYSFRHDFGILISGVLTSADLVNKIVSGLGLIISGIGGSFLVIFNKFKGKDDAGTDTQ